jgi:hypothetical protein
MRTLRSALILVTLASGASGCLASRSLLSYRAGGEKTVSFVETADTYNVLLWPVQRVHQFWKCIEAAGVITCQKECSSTNTDLTCPAQLVQGRASLGGGNSVQ